eukprot:34210_3
MLLRLMVDFSHTANSFRSPLSENEAVSDVQKLWGVHEAEANERAVARAKKLFVHADNFCLPYRETVNDRLVVWLDSCWVVQDNFSCELPCSAWTSDCVNEDHSLPNKGALDLFQGKAGCLAGSNFHGNASCVNALDLYRSKHPNSVRTKQESVVHADGSADHRPGDNCSNTCHVESSSIRKWAVLLF